MEPLPQDHNQLTESLPGSQMSPNRRAGKEFKKIRKIMKMYPFMLNETENTCLKKKWACVYVSVGKNDSVYWILKESKR